MVGVGRRASGVGRRASGVGESQRVSKVEVKQYRRGLKPTLFFWLGSAELKLCVTDVARAF
jgi:hypothetical protein